MTFAVKAASRNWCLHPFYQICGNARPLLELVQWMQLHLSILGNGCMNLLILRPRTSITVVLTDFSFKWSILHPSIKICNKVLGDFGGTEARLASFFTTTRTWLRKARLLSQKIDTFFFEAKATVWSRNITSLVFLGSSVLDLDNDDDGEDSVNPLPIIIDRRRPPSSKFCPHRKRSAFNV